jgi:two-component system cell cycle sensor histidine kinase/response regulator CckA
LNEREGEVFTRLFFSIHHPLCLFDITRGGDGAPRDLLIVAVNPAFERLMGVEGKTLEGAPAHAAFPDFRDVWDRVDAEAASGRAGPHVFIHRTDGNRYYEVRAFFPARDRVATLITDVTDLSAEKEEHKRLQSQLLHAQKMEAIGRLAGGVAHDFNNLLTAIQGYADLALLQVEKTAIVSESLEQIRKATERAAKLSRQLLIFSRKEPMDLKPKNLNDIVTNLCDMVKRIIGENIGIEFELEPDVWVTMVNQGQIEQVVMNLAVNARDAMPDGGTLSIKTENVVIDARYCEAYSYAREGKFVCLAVEDSGVGMDGDTMGKIFEPFFTTKKEGEGTGLGLSVVYGIVKEHEGWINVYSEPGRGTVFRAYLPVCGDLAVQEERPISSAGDLRGRGERILLVEDEKIILNFMRKRLTEEGYVVFTAENAEDALRIYEAENSSFDLLFTDVVLPDKTGIALVEKLFEKNPALKVLVTSGYDYTRSKWPALENANVKFIRKPYTVGGLLLAIRSSIDDVCVEEDFPETR